MNELWGKLPYYIIGGGLIAIALLVCLAMILNYIGKKRGKKK